MQIGREAEARDLFDAAFDADPFNVRADNMMKVLKHMASYEPIETDALHRPVTRGRTRCWASTCRATSNRSIAELTERFGFEPPGQTQIEIMKDHQWFSGRTIGLPFIPTVGACTGKVVALASPRTTNKPFNWARVLKHEVAHVITLQQTELQHPPLVHRGPGRRERGDPPARRSGTRCSWSACRARKLLNLDTINLGFIRPDEPEDRQMAYCQAQLYAQYMLKRFGDDALIKMLDAYRRGLTTDRADRRVLRRREGGLREGLPRLPRRGRQDDPHPGQRRGAGQVLAARTPAQGEARRPRAERQDGLRALRPARLSKGPAPSPTRRWRLQPHHPLASYVKARLFQSIGDDDSALKLLEPALDPEKPERARHRPAGRASDEGGRLDEAERLYELARKDDPYHTKWIAGLARVHLRQKDKEKFLHDLAMLAANDADDLDVRKALAEYHLAANHPEQAEKWAIECLYIDVYDPQHHVLLADALDAQKKYADAIEEYQVALELQPRKANDIRLKLAQAQRDNGQRDDARASLDAILRADPEHPEAKALRGDREGRMTLTVTDDGGHPAGARPEG